MMRRTAGLAWGWLPSSVIVLTLPLSAVTGWSVQSIGDVVLGAIVITMTVWAVTTKTIAWRWVPAGFALGLVCTVAVSAVFPKLLLPHVPFRVGLDRLP